MRETRSLMGMPVSVEIVGGDVDAQKSIESVYTFLTEIDARFSPYKENSEISRINRREVMPQEYSPEMQEVFALAEKTKEESRGYFNMQRPDGTLDPSGITKGWAIKMAAELLQSHGFINFYIDAGGDIQPSGTNVEGKEWSVGIRSPFNTEEIVKILYPKGRGVATSGSYERGAHIYNPHDPEGALEEIVSITVIGPDVLEADRFATAAFAMGRSGATFIDSLPGFAGYMIDRSGIATMTRNFDHYLKP